jgi:autotransporter-associated beta strand protein
MKKSGISRTATTTLRLGLALGLALAAPAVSRAGILYWGADGSGGSGTWDAGVTTNWFDGSAVVWPATSSGDDDAYFYGLGDMITIAPGGVTANDLKFYADGCTIQGGTLTLDLDGSLTNTPSLEMGAGINTTISAVLAGTNGFSKFDAGTLTLSGSNTFSGNVYFGDPATQGTGPRPSSGVIRITQSGALGVLGNNVQPDGATNQLIHIRDNGDQLVLDGSGSDITLPDYQVFITSGPNGVIRNVAGSNTVNGEILLSTGASDTGITSDGGALTLAGLIHGGSANHVLRLLGTNSAVNNISGVISNGTYATNLTRVWKRSGANTWQLSNSNSYSDGTFIGLNPSAEPYVSDGIIRLAHNNAAGTGPLTVYGGYQAGRFELAGDITVSNAISFYGRQGFTYPAIRNVSGSNTLTGNINVIANGARLNIESAAGWLTIAGNPMTGSSGRTLTLRGAGTGNFAKNINTNVVSTLDKLDAGTWILSGTNIYTGKTTVSGGRLQFVQPLSLYSNTPASWTAANLDVKSNAVASFNVGGAGEFSSSDIATLAALGTTNGGFENGAILGLDTANAAVDFDYSGNLINPNAGTNRLGLHKLGANRLILSGTNTFTGGVTVFGGQLRIANPRALDTASFRWITATANAPLELDGTAGDITVSSTNGIQTSGSVINNVAGNNAILGEIFRTTGVGGTTITSSGGTLTLAGPIKSSGVRSLTLAGSSTGPNTVSGSIQDGSAGNYNPLIKTGTGTWILSGTNTYTGPTTISAGLLIVTGSLTNTAVTNTGGILVGTGTLQGPVVIEAAGTLEPGTTTSLGETLTINNDLTLAGTALVQIGKSGAIPVNDSVVGVTNISYGGTLIVTNATGATFADGDAFVLFSASGTKTGNFTNIVVAPAEPSLIASFNPTNGTLSFASAVVVPPTLYYTNQGGGVIEFGFDNSSKLVWQTNTLAVGLSTNWLDYPDTNNPVRVTNNPAIPASFFGLEPK